MLAAGTILGPYKILAPLGTGGMGEVYRAHDGRLGRDVAIKVLPTHLAATPEVRARFEREARTISQLNHPHICTLYDIGRQNGLDYLVMELLGGETLAHRLEKGPLSAAELLRVAIEVAGALDTAHRHGVIHRDLKPANVMLTPSGAKLLDFGLARSSPFERMPTAISESPTVSQPLTAEGTIVGTMQYMAPEQLEGKEADARTDLWALGAMLYEMASGRKAFEASSRASLIAAIMDREPSPLSALAATVTPGFERVVRQCMAKDPDQRWQTARDLIHELEWIREDSASGAHPASTSGVRSVAAGRPRIGRKTWVAGGVLALLLAAAAVFIPKRPPKLNPAMTTRAVQLPFVEINYPGMSSDGKWIALPASDGQGRWGLYFMNLGGGEPRLVAAADPGDNIAYADVSPDGSQLAYEVSGTGFYERVFVVPSLGGVPRMVAEGGVDPHWSPDGRRVGFLRVGWGSRSARQELWSVCADGSDPRLHFVDSLSTGSNRFCFSWSPDGRQIVWTRGFNQERTQELVVRVLASGAERQLTHDGAGIDEMMWTRQDDIVFSSNRSGNSNLWMMRASGGPAVQVTSGIGPDIGMRVSSDGKTLLCLQRQYASTLWIGDLADGRSSQVTHDDRVLGTASPSPNGRQILVPVLEPDPISRGGAIEVMNRDGTDRRVLVSGLDAPRSVDWAPSGRWISYNASPASWGLDSSAIYVADSSGRGSRRVGTGIDAFWTNDSSLAIRGPLRSTLVSARDGSLLNTSADSTSEYPMREGNFLVSDARKGREGWWVRAAAPARGRVVARTFVAPRSVNAVAVARDASYLLCVPEVGRIERIHIPSGRRERLPWTFPGLTPSPSTGLSGPGLRVAADGDNFVYLRPVVSSKLVLIEHLR